MKGPEWIQLANWQSHLTHSEPDGSVGLKFEVVEKFEVTRQVRSMSILDLSGGGFLQDDSRDRSCDSQININSEKKKRIGYPILFTVHIQAL